MIGQLDLRRHEWAKHERLIVFDGVCNWCNAGGNFPIARDLQGTFKFGTLQSAKGQQALNDLRIPTDDFETFLLLEQGLVFTKSTAALRTLRQLSGLWPLLYIGIVIPRPVRDAIYDYVARHRYRWMGKADTCRVTTPAECDRFV